MFVFNSINIFFSLLMPALETYRDDRTASAKVVEPYAISDPVLLAYLLFLWLSDEHFGLCFLLAFFIAYFWLSDKHFGPCYLLAFLLIFFVRSTNTFFCATLCLSLDTGREKCFTSRCGGKQPHVFATRQQYRDSGL